MTKLILISLLAQMYTRIDLTYIHTEFRLIFFLNCAGDKIVNLQYNNRISYFILLGYVSKKVRLNFKTFVGIFIKTSTQDIPPFETVLFYFRFFPKFPPPPCNYSVIVFINHITLVIPFPITNQINLAGNSGYAPLYIHTNLRYSL